MKKIVCAFLACLLLLSLTGCFAHLLVGDDAEPTPSAPDAQQSGATATAPSASPGTDAASAADIPEPQGKLTVDASKAVEVPITVEGGGVLSLEQDGAIMQIIIPEENVGADTVFTIAPVTETPLNDETEIVKGFEIREKGNSAEHVQLLDYACIQFVFDEDPGDDFTIVRYGETFEDCQAIYTIKQQWGEQWLLQGWVTGFSSYGLSPKNAYGESEKWTPDPEKWTTIISVDEVTYQPIGGGEGGAIHLRMRLYCDSERVMEFDAEEAGQRRVLAYPFYGTARLRVYTFVNGGEGQYHADLYDDNIQLTMEMDAYDFETSGAYLLMQLTSNYGEIEELGQYHALEGKILQLPIHITRTRNSIIPGRSTLDVYLDMYDRVTTAEFEHGVVYTVPQTSRDAKKAGTPVKPFVDAAPSKIYDPNTQPAPQQDPQGDNQQPGVQPSAQQPAQAQTEQQIADALAKAEAEFANMKDKMTPEQQAQMEQTIEGMRKALEAVRK